MPDYGHQRSSQRSSQDRREQQLEVVRELRQRIERYQRLKDLPAEELVNVADRLGRYLKENNLKTSQVRRFLDGVRRIDVQFDKGKSFNRDSIILLKPKLAYAAGRQSSVKPLMDILEPAISASTDSYESFKKLLALIEGIMAYHKFHGGGD